MEPLDRGLVAVTIDLSGESIEKVKEEASLRAVRSCVGRIFWGRDLLIALDLLSEYLQNNHFQFVRGIETLRTDFTAGRPELTLRVYVDYYGLAHDLREKRFVLTPRPRPYFKVFLAERLGEEFATYKTGQEALNAALKDRNLYPYEGAIDRPPDNVDVVKDSILLEDALIACERYGIELLVSGTSVTTRDAVKELYYDTYYFYTTTLQVTMVRVDNGEVISRAEAKGAASHTDERRAIDLSITEAANEATGLLIQDYDKVWGPMVLDRADYHLLLTGVTPQTLSLVKDSLAGFSVDSKVFLRQSYDRAAVLNVVYPGKREDLLKAISTLSYPTLSIIPPRAIDAKVVGESVVRKVEQMDIGRKLGARKADGETGTYNYIYETEIALRLLDRGNDRPVIGVTAKAQASGLDAQDTAITSWRNALSQALLELNRTFPASIQVVNLREGSHRIQLARDQAQLADAFAQRLRRDTALGAVARDTERGLPIIRIRYNEPADPEESLLGRDPFLPDPALVSSARRNYFEIQVGE